MDDTQTNRVSDAAAATRKRRSSILKSQRPPRTPFSDLEFNVATPTDSAKSRRVSFSRRTGVAEFATNEATTTWKNFYEEHNKSLETSGEGGARQPVAHLGQRAFDLQFQSELETDIIGSLHTGPNINISSSLNNFEQQLASLECTENIKLPTPHNNFELSAFTNTRSKLFDDLVIPPGEVTDHIDINFSALQQVGGDDDLDEIQKDIKQIFGNAPCRRQNISEYIEVDLNMTNVMNNEGDNMSITDTVHSPKVEDLSKSTSSKNLDKDWVVDKENVAFNPYTAPRETENFAINEDLDKVLVFDGKRLTITSEKTDKENYRKTLLPNAPDKAPKRKTIVLNVNDDLPNFKDDPISNNSGFLGVAELKKNLVIDDMSITEPLEQIKQQSTIYDGELGNISETQAVPSVMSKEGHRTVLYEDNGNISVTKAIPTNIIAEKRRTIYNDSNLSITQGLPTNVQETIAQSEKRKTIVFNDGDISMTQALPINILDKVKRRTILYEDNTGNLSITQAVPNILIKEAKSEKQRTIVYEDDTGNISVTRAIPSNIIFAEKSSDRRRTVVFESDTGNISVTQAVPSNLVLQEQMNINSQVQMNTQVQIENTRRRTILYENDTGNLSITQAVPSKVIQSASTRNVVSQDGKRRTIVFDNDDANISVTQAVSLNQIICALKNDEDEKRLGNDTNNAQKNQIRTDIQKNLPINDVLINETNKRRTVVFDNEDANISVTQAVPINVIHNLNQFSEAIIPSKAELKRRTVVFENDEADISMTQAVNINQLIPGFVQNVQDDLEAALNEALHNKDVRRSQRTIVCENTETSQNDKEHNINISVSLSFQDNVNANAIKQKTAVYEDNNISMTQALPLNIISEIANMNNARNESEEPNAAATFYVSSVDMHGAKVKKSFNSKRKSVNIVTKPIPSHLSTIIGEDSKSATSKYSAVETSSKNISNVLVNQVALSKRTEQSDTQSQEPLIVIKDDTKLSSSPKINDDVKHEKIVEYKIADAIEVNQSSESACHEIQTKEQMTENKETPQNQTEMTEQTNQSEISDDLSQTSDTTSQMSKSILDNFLDMSSAECNKVKSLMAQVDDKETDSDKLSTIPESSTRTNSNDTPFYIKDVEDEAQIQTDKCDSTELPQPTGDSPLPLDNCHNKLEIHKGAISNETSVKNSHYEKILSSDKTKKEVIVAKESNNINTANDTNKLLEMLSDLTDETMEKNLDTHLEEDKENPKSFLVKGHLALENKSKVYPEPRRFSFAPVRQSIALSREHLLNNISLAEAALKSRCFDNSELEDTIEDSPEDTPPKKSVRLSNEVVKTLHFDESVDDSSVHDIKLTPFEKTAMGETSYAQEHKAKVIPDVLKDVADDTKNLRDDLVKPNTDVPFDAAKIDKSIRKIPSPCSTQIQANLVTSSQIDTNTGLYSNPDSIHDVNVDKISSVDMINDAVNRSVSRLLKSPIKSAKLDVSITDAQTIVASRHMTEIKTGLTQYNEGNHLIHSVKKSGEASLGKIAESQNIDSNLCKPVSIDQSIGAKLNDMENPEVNALTAMKGNKELLDASSSLILVDDALALSTFDVEIDARTTTSQEDMAKSPVRVINTGKREEMLSEKLDFDFTSNDDLGDRKSKKRIYSPAKRDEHCTKSNLEVTPKPTTKMVKLSESPNGLPIHVSQSASEKEKNDSNKKSPRKSNSKSGTSVTVQQLRNPKSDNPVELIQTASQSNEQECKGLDMVTSFTSSKNVGDDRSGVTSSQSSKASRMDWQPDIDDLRSKNLSECDSNDNVVAKIEMLPFMGSEECKWESSGDTWMFRLLHSRLRLVVRFAHGHENAPRTRVRAGTPVCAVALETLPHDAKSTVAALGVSFAADTMRHLARGAGACARAGDVPALVRRCVAVARFAARWARAMADARLQLAYCLAADGALTLKVANIPLRCVWEVSNRLELVVGDASETPWVRASDVRVHRVPPAAGARDERGLRLLPRLLRDLPRDWSHAPRTIWKVFKYLKHKTRDDDDELFMEMSNKM